MFEPVDGFRLDKDAEHISPTHVYSYQLLWQGRGIGRVAASRVIGGYRLPNGWYVVVMMYDTWDSDDVMVALYNEGLQPQELRSATSQLKPGAYTPPIRVKGDYLAINWPQEGRELQVRVNLNPYRWWQRWLKSPRLRLARSAYTG